MAGAPQRRDTYDRLAGLGGIIVRIAGGVMVLAVTVAVIALLGRFLFWIDLAMSRWAHGQPLDWTGIGAFLTAIGGLAVTVGPIIIASSRNQRLRDIAHAQAGSPPPLNPTPPAPAPSSGPDAGFSNGGLINNAAIQGDQQS